MSFGNLGAPELGLILILVLLIFGPNHIAQLGGELGKSIRAFRTGVQYDAPGEVEIPNETTKETA